MLRRVTLAAVLLSAAACAPSIGQRPDPLAQNIIDEAGLNALLLKAGDSRQAVAYFERAVATEPERPDLRRGLAISYSRAGRHPEAFRTYQELDSLGQMTSADMLDYAFTAIKLQRYEDAIAIEERLPAGLNTARRHQLTGMLADHQKDWDAADAAYQRAELLSSQPAKILNNWGVSKMARGDLAGAEATFARAVSYDSTLFSAKNNLAIARGLQGNYRLPVVPLTDREKATVLNNLGIIAARRNETSIARGLFAAAVDAHPQHYQGAADRLASLQTVVEN